VPLVKKVLLLWPHTKEASMWDRVDGRPRLESTVALCYIDLLRSALIITIYNVVPIFLESKKWFSLEPKFGTSPKKAFCEKYEANRGS